MGVAYGETTHVGGTNGQSVLTSHMGGACSRGLGLTQAVVAIVGQHETIETGAAVVPGDVDALVHAATVVVVIVTLVDVCRGAREGSEGELELGRW